MPQRRTLLSSTAWGRGFFIRSAGKPSHRRQAGNEAIRPGVVNASPVILLGKAEVLAWALAHPGYTAVLDDRAARRQDAKIGVPVLGSLRVIVKAKERGLIPRARPALEKLRGSGAYVSDELIDRAIELAGEA